MRRETHLTYRVRYWDAAGDERVDVVELPICRDLQSWFYDEHPDGILIAETCPELDLL